MGKWGRRLEINLESRVEGGKIVRNSWIELIRSRTAAAAMPGGLFQKHEAWSVKSWGGIRWREMKER